jgi:hypothetical protein
VTISRGWGHDHVRSPARHGLMCSAPAAGTSKAIHLRTIDRHPLAIPHLLVDPLGSILKIFPIMLAILFVLAILDER